MDMRHKMTTGNLSPVRLLQMENNHLKAENRELKDELLKLRSAFSALRTLQEVSMSIDVNTDVLSLVGRILESCLATIGSKDGSLMLVDEETEELAFVVVQGEAKERLTGHRIPLGQGIAGWVAKNARNVIVPNVNVDPRFSSAVDKEFQFKTRSLLCVPMVTNGKVLGVIQAINKTNEREFDDDDLTLLAVVAQLAATAIVKAEEIIMAEAEDEAD